MTQCSGVVEGLWMASDNVCFGGFSHHCRVDKKLKPICSIKETFPPEFELMMVKESSIMISRYTLAKINTF